MTDVTARLVPTGRFLTSILSVLGLAAFLSACGEDQSAEAPSETPPAATAEAEPASAPEATEAPMEMAAADTGEMDHSTMDHAAMGHGDHMMTQEQFTELREKIPLYQGFTDEQIMENMGRMPPDMSVLVSAPDVTGDIGILALGHGYTKGGNSEFEAGFTKIAETYPTAIGFGMAMMDSAAIQQSLDALEAAGATTIVVLPSEPAQNSSLMRQWKYIFGRLDEAAYLSVPQVETDAKIIWGPTPTASPVLSQILLNLAEEKTEDPANTLAIVLAHGPEGEEDNVLELATLEDHAAFIAENGGYYEAKAATIQDDAPEPIRTANMQRVRGWIEEATAAGRDVVVVTTLLTGPGGLHDRINRDLEGLTYTMNGKGTMSDPLFTQWIEEAVKKSLEEAA